MDGTAAGGWLSELRKRYGPAALVTGASDGIGEAAARLLAQAGFTLVIVARRRERLEHLAAELSARHGVEVDVVVADLATPAGVDAVLSAAQHHEIGLFMAAAGFGSSGRFLGQPVGEELAMVDVNCRACVALVHTIGGAMAARGRGAVVLMSSLVAFHGAPFAATYAATKAFIQSFAEALSREWAGTGLAVVASAPGPTQTGFAARARMTMARTEDARTVAAGTLKALARGRSFVRPGALSKLLGWSLATAPRALRVRIVGSIMKGMSGS